MSLYFYKQIIYSVSTPLYLLSHFSCDEKISYKKWLSARDFYKHYKNCHLLFRPFYVTYKVLFSFLLLSILVSVYINHKQKAPPSRSTYDFYALNWTQTPFQNMIILLWIGLTKNDLQLVTSTNIIRVVTCCLDHFVWLTRFYFLFCFCLYLYLYILITNKKTLPLDQHMTFMHWIGLKHHFRIW